MADTDMEFNKTDYANYNHEELVEIIKIQLQLICKQRESLKAKEELEKVSNKLIDEQREFIENLIKTLNKYCEFNKSLLNEIQEETDRDKDFLDRQNKLVEQVKDMQKQY